MAVDGVGRYVTLLADVVQAAGHVQVVRSSSYRSPVIAKAAGWRRALAFRPGLGCLALGGEGSTGSAVG
jgi:hypothetical protein